MLCEQIWGKLPDFDLSGKTVEYVDIEWHEAFKKYIKDNRSRNRDRQPPCTAVLGRRRYVYYNLQRAHAYYAAEDSRRHGSKRGEKARF